MKEVNLFSIAASRPTIHTFREQQELEEIEIRSTWANSKTLHMTVPLSKVHQDPWGKQPTLSAQCGGGHPLEIKDQVGDAYTISLTNIADVHLKIGTKGSFRNCVIYKPFSIERGEDDTNGNPTFRLHGRENNRFDLKTINQTGRYLISSQRIQVRPEPANRPILTRDQWLLIDETSTLTLEIYRPNEEKTFHAETVTVEPAPVSEYSPSIERQTGRFSGGRQTMEVRVSGLHSSQRNSIAKFNWEGEESATEFDIINGVFSLPVPLVKSEAQGFLVIPAQKTRLMIERYSDCSEDTCTFEQTRKSVAFSSDQAEEPFLTLNQTGEWVGNLCVMLVAKNNQRTASEVLMAQSIPLPQNGQTIDMSLAWLLERIPGLKLHVLDTSLDATFELNVHLFCGQNEEDRSERISTQLLQPESIIQIGEALHFDEGREESESVVFTYDQFYFDEDEDFVLNIPSAEFRATSVEGKIVFEIDHPSVHHMSDDSVWQLMHQRHQVLSGPYLLWPVEVFPPDMEATILVDSHFKTIAYPGTLFVLKSQLLPSQTEMDFQIKFGSKQTKPIRSTFLREAEEGDGLQSQSISMRNFLGDVSQDRDEKWLEMCKKEGEGKIADYSLVIPSRNQGSPRWFSLLVKIDENASYLAALRMLKQISAVSDIPSIKEFLAMDHQDRDVMEDIITIVVNHVYTRHPGLQSAFFRAMASRGTSNFAKLSAEFVWAMSDPYTFFFDLFGTTFEKNYSRRAKFLEEVQDYFSKPTKKSHEELVQLWEII